jgi:hypothetical protein
MPQALIKFNLRRIRLNRGGYDAYGAYYGLGHPLYEAVADIDNEHVQIQFRAPDRRAAKAKLVAIYATGATAPVVSFYR